MRQSIKYRMDQRGTKIVFKYKEQNMNIIKKTLTVISTILMILIKFVLFMVVMLGGAYLLAPMGSINSKDIEMSLFTNTPNETMMLLLNSEYFSGYLFAVTLLLYALFVTYSGNCMNCGAQVAARLRLPRHDRG
eukprot:TRINITY_DN32094_c0_g1_i1.p1 TRINITY_DN32094_c0_g1~~TRINITY_DN32094_c0_g1_i1.p1  ORF type:complete len:134 (+),score=20.46 TRINITY_DN32094_c0_g1_i1:115-516(+)